MLLRTQPLTAPTLLCQTIRSRPASFVTRRGACRGQVRCMAAAGPLELVVKGNPETQTLGDCPFCHRVLLTAAEKKAPYELKYVEFSNKPKWLLEVNPAGSVPVAKTPEGKWLTDSAAIVDYLEETYPEPALGKADSAAEEGAKVFPAFVGLIKASPEEEGAKKAALLDELALLNAHLAQGGPHLKGEQLTTGDLALAPKLHHLEVAGKALKGFEIPAEFSAIQEYLASVRSRDSWQASKYGDDLVVAGWKPKLHSA